MMGTASNERSLSVAGALGLTHTMGLGRVWVAVVAAKTVCFIVGFNFKKDN